MNPFFKKIILSVIVVAIFMAPVSGSLNLNNKQLAVGVETNKAEATEAMVFNQYAIDSTDASYTITVSDTQTGYVDSGIDYKLYIKTWATGTTMPKDAQPVQSGTLKVTENTANQTVPLILKNLKPQTNYYIMADLMREHYSINPLNPLSTPEQTIDSNLIQNIEFNTPADNSTQGTTTVNSSNNYNANNGLELGCTSLTSISLSGCVAQLSYILWSVSAAVARVAGEFLDFFVYYSTNSSSYKNDFVTKAWGAVRDIANIFFIIALLYIAIKTVLSLNVTDNKKLISAVIIVALIINFSLFATELVIDASNILAKVFYNNINSVDKSSNPATGAEGEKSISVGLVDKFDPQTLITQSVYQANPYTFIFMTLISAAVLLYMIYIFFSVALLFVGRVISLWISMIFSPIAFASYSVPFDIPGFGHKEWWKQLLENAFLAPLFIFFLYIIILFTDFLKDIIKYTDNPNLTSAANTTQHLMSVIIPFAIIFMLLGKAKKLAVQYSGEMGAAISKIGAAVGGLALGAATGGTAMIARGTIGKGMSAAANSGWAKKWEAKGYGGGMARTLLKSGATGSFDLRGVKIGGKGLANTGLTNLGKAQEGGYEKTRKDKVEKRQKRAEELKVGEDEKLTQTVNKAETDLQVLLNQTTKEFERIDKELVAARQKKADNANSPPGSAGEVAHNAAIAEIEALKTRKTDIREGRAVGAVGAGPAIGPTTVVSGPNAGRTIKEMENTIIPDAKNAKLTESRRRTTNFANKIMGNKFTRIVTFPIRGGRENREAQHKIIMESKLDSGTKT